MDTEMLKRKAAVQRSHAFIRAKERYGLYLDDYLYTDLLDVIQGGLKWIRETGSRYSPSVKFLSSQETGKAIVLKVFFLDEWMLLVYDRETKEVRTFLPPKSRYVKNADVSAA